MRNAVKKTTLQFRTREQKRGSNSGRPVMNNQTMGKPKRAGEWHPPGWKSHSDPIIRSRRSRRTRQNRGTALPENTWEVEVETLEQHQKATRQQVEENGTQSRPARRRKPQPSSRHTSWAHEDGDRNRKGGQVKNKAHKPRS